MNNRGMISQQWIDRETFQKLFRTFYNKRFDPTRSRSQTKTTQKRLQKRTAPFVSLLGIYDKEKSRFYNGFSLTYKKSIPTISSKTGDIEVLLSRRLKEGNSIKYRLLSKVRVATDLNMEILSETGGKIIKLKQVPVIARLPIPESVFNNKKDRKNLRLVVRETFWTIEPAVKNKGYIHNVSMGEGNTVSKKRKILYNAPVDWEAKPENLIIKEREER